MHIELLSHKNEEKWDKFINGSNRAGIWYSLEWMKILKNEYKYKPFYLIAVDNQGDCCGVLPLFHVRSFITGNRLVSLPFSHNCGPLAVSNEILVLLLERAKKLVSDLQCDYLELKMEDTIPNEVVEKSGLFENRYYYTSILKLSRDPDELWKKLDARRTRWAINKARRSGVKICREVSEDDIKIFHDLKVATRKKHGSPTPSLRFFKNLMQAFHEKGLLRLWLAKYDEQVVSGLMFYSYKDTVTPAYIASDEKFNSFMPNNLLYWEAIEWACKNGYQYFNFGRTEPGNETLLKFKSKWGTDNFKIPYYYYPKLPKLISMQRTGFKHRLITGTWRRMPITLMKIIGPVLYKHLG
jgi:FemAB-related protein (PEP-CTERM system-associated)